MSHWDLPRQETPPCMLGSIGKPLVSRGAMSWFHNVSTYNEEVIKHWTFLSLKISLNIKKPKLLSGHLVLLESPQQVGFKKSDFEKKFIEFRIIFINENPNKLQKLFLREKWVG